MDLELLHNSQKLREHVIQELTSVGGTVKGEEINILCPFHHDTKPSLNVHIGHKITPGSYNCFACRANGSWNDLARALKMKPMSLRISKKGEGQTKKVVSNKDEIDPFKLMLQEIKQNVAYKKYKPTTLKGLEPLPDSFQWRGVPKKFYQRLDASYYWTEQNQSMHFPLTVNGKYRGYTLCTVASSLPKFKKYLIFAEASKNLFLYDHLGEQETIVLTEGHFDALRLMYEGFNATAIFGVQNWSTYKRDLIIAKNPPRVVIAFDGDKPGYEASVEIFNTFRDIIDVDIFYLPLKDPKLDPGNMSEEYLTLLREKTDV